MKLIGNKQASLHMNIWDGSWSECDHDHQKKNQKRIYQICTLQVVIHSIYTAFIIYMLMDVLKFFGVIIGFDCGDMRFIAFIARKVTCIKYILLLVEYNVALSLSGH